MWKSGVRRVRELPGMMLMGYKKLHCWDSLELWGVELEVAVVWRWETE